MALIKTSVFTYANSLSTPFHHPYHSTIHSILNFLVGIICGPYRGSFPVRDHLRSNLGIICGPGSFAVLGSFADPYRLNCSQCDFVYYGQTERSLKMRVSEHKKAVLMFDHNSKLACHVHERHHRMDFENVEVGHEAHYHQRLSLEGWMSVKDPNAGNDHRVIPEVYKCLART